MRKEAGSGRTVIIACIVVAFICLCHTLVLGATSEDADRLNARVAQLYQLGRYAEAIRLAEKALAIARQLPGNHPSTASSYNNLGTLYEATGEYGKAECSYQNALTIWRKAPGVGDKHPLTATAYNNLGNLYRTISDYRQAESMLQKALTIKEDGLFKKGRSTATANNNLGDLYRELGDYAEAEPLLQKALAICIEVVGVKHPDTAQSYGNLGRLYESMGEYGKAEPLLKKALMIHKEFLGEKHPDTVTSYNNLGTFYVSTGDYAEAEPFLQKALVITRETMAENHLDTARGYNNLAMLYQSVGDYGKAGPLFKNALVINKGTLGEKHPLTAIGYNNLGVLYKTMGDYATAEPLLRKASMINEETLGEEHPSTVASYSNLGFLYLSMGKADAALRIFKKIYTPSGLGHCYLVKRDYKVALAKFEESLFYSRKSSRKEFIIADHIGLGLSYEGLRDYRKAREHYKKAVELIEAQGGSLMPPQRRTFLAGMAGGFSRLEPYEGLVRVSCSLKDAGEGFYWAENTRARVLLEVIARRRVNSKTGLPTRLAQEEESLNNRIAAKHKQIKIATEKLPDRVKGLEEELKELQKEKKSLIARLRREYPEYASIKYPMPSRAKDIQLQPGEVLIEYEVTDKATFAWVIRGGETIKAVSIPVSRKELREKITAYRKGFEDISRHADLSRFDPLVGKAIYDLLFLPLSSHLKDEETLIFVSDEILAILPFETLVVDIPDVLKTASGKHGPYPEGVTYLGDRYPIGYAQSATTLMVTRTLKKKGGVKGERMLVVADPVFDMADARVTGREKIRLASADTFQVGRIKSMAKALGGEEVFRRLKKTGQLAQDLRGSYGNGVEVLEGFAATEETLRKRPLGQYQYQVFATHGILDNQIAYIQEPALVLSQVGVDSQDRKRDGFLTMTEVMDLKFNADVAALTACSTGMGKNLTGEGVMHMGRAFQYAGARSVLMSLWSVDENSTTLLTERFFAHLKEKKPPKAAIHQARQDVRQAGYEHPYYWGGFILMAE